MKISWSSLTFSPGPFAISPSLPKRQPSANNEYHSTSTAVSIYKLRLSLPAQARDNQKHLVQPQHEMCTGQSFYFSGCGHSQSQYTRLCPLSKDKTQTSCDRLEYAGAQSGICAACRSLDERIEQLKVEIRDRERELADAMGARGIPVQAYGDVIAVDDRYCEYVVERERGISGYIEQVPEQGLGNDQLSR
jgi:hypothetical protein